MSEYQEAPSKSNLPFILISFILLIGIGVMTFLYSRTSGSLDDCTNENKLLLSDMEGMNQMMEGYVGNMSNDLRTDFKNMLSTYDALIAKDKTKADSLNAQKEKIQDLLDQLNTSKKLSANQIFKLRKENETLRGIMKSYVVQIDSLNTLNVKLTSALDKTSNELTSTKTERDQYRQEAETSAEQVKKGSKLTAFGFSSVGLRMKLNNTTEESNRAKGIVQFRSTFTISENPIAKAGNKKVYLQILNPDGKTMQNKSSNMIQTDAGNIPFSDVKEINYNNERIDVTIFYDLKGETALKGNYKVRVYCEGSLIGTDSFTLK